MRAGPEDRELVLGACGIMGDGDSTEILTVKLDSPRQVCYICVLMVYTIIPLVYR